MALRPLMEIFDLVSGMPPNDTIKTIKHLLDYSIMAICTANIKNLQRSLRGELFGDDVNDTEYEDSSGDEVPDNALVKEDNIRRSLQANPNNGVLSPTTTLSAPASNPDEEPNPKLPSLTTRLPVIWSPINKIIEHGKKAEDDEWTKGKR